MLASGSSLASDRRYGGFPVSSVGAAAMMRFGPFEIDVEARLLLRESRAVALGSRAMDILIALVARPGHLVSTQELIASAWPKSAAGEANLRGQMFVLRRALGDGDDEQRFIQNVPGRGYRFACLLEDQAQDQPAPGPAVPQFREFAASRIFGRDEFIAEMLARLPHRRLLTIVGPGGIGKSTVALAIADAFSPTCADGVQWVDLSALTRDQSPAEAIAVAVSLVNYANDHSPAVISWLKDKHLLLVLDCADRVVSGVAVLAEKILCETSDVHILVTSRETLRAAGEHFVRLPPLAVPPDAHSLPAVGAMAFPAIQLFVDRAAAVLGGFTLSDENVPYVARICARLDGIALAIELAAGHLVALELRNLAALLDDKFRLLPMGRRGALARHRTMHAVLEWSFDTLSPPERNVLLGLAIFEGESSMAAIRAVTLDDAFSTEDLAAATSQLVDKSLVATRIAASGVTYYLLDTTRSFALERLKEAGKLLEVSRRHAVFMLATLRKMETESYGFRAADLLDVRRRELANIRAALNWANESAAGEPLHLALSVTGARILLDLSLVEQCRRRVSQALRAMTQHQTSDLQLEMRLEALSAIASYYTPGPVQETVDALERVFAIAENLDASEYRAIALWGLWSVSIFRSEPARALSFAERFRSNEADLSGAARNLLADRMTGSALHFLGDQPRARDCLERVSTQYDPVLHSWTKTGFHIDHGLMARVYLARVLWLQGESELALRTCQDCLDALRAQGHAIAQCHALFEVAIPLTYMAGDLETANFNLGLLQELSAIHGLSIFQAGAAWTARAFAAIRLKTALCDCRAAAQELRTCRYETQYPWLSGLMAEEALRRGEIATGIEWISACLSPEKPPLGGWWLAELQRLQGELVAAGRAPADRAVALAYMQQAIVTAQQQGALMLELRATISRIGLERGYRAHRDLKSELDGVLDKFRQESGAGELIAARRLSAELAD
jgi:predicted ATPase/DNA-binding winged helix-turn-helix (wHTH) protein